MIAQTILEILVCPETHQPVRPADAGLVAKLNDQVSAGTLRNRAGKAIASRLDSGLLREDGKFLYPIRNGIPVMLTGEAIPLR